MVWKYLRATWPRPEQPHLLPEARSPQWHRQQTTPESNEASSTRTHQHFWGILQCCRVVTSDFSQNCKNYSCNRGLNKREWVAFMRVGRVSENQRMGSADSKGVWSKKFLPQKKHCSIILMEKTNAWQWLMEITLLNVTNGRLSTVCCLGRASFQPINPWLICGKGRLKWSSYKKSYKSINNNKIKL